MGKLTISTEDKRFSVNLSEMEANAEFNNIVLSLLTKDKNEIKTNPTSINETISESKEESVISASIMEKPLAKTLITEVCPDNSSNIQNFQKPFTPLEGFRGFLHLKCEHCGEDKTFNAKYPMTFFKCEECGKETKLERYTKIFATCECGKRSTYRTNILGEEGMCFDINCFDCRSPIAVKFNSHTKVFESINKHYGR